jgi:hypothetical protein
MRFRLIGRLLALLGLYALVLAAIGTRQAGQAHIGYQTGLVELVIATVLLVVAAVVVIARRPREPLDEDSELELKED